MSQNKLTKLRLENFTAFRELEVEFSPGINIFIGENGTGKTHLLKLLYSMSASKRQASSKSTESILRDVFKPYSDYDFIHFKARNFFIEAESNNRKINIRMEKNDPEMWSDGPDHIIFESVIYIPSKDFLANAPGFISLYDQKFIHFEKVYYDILSNSYLPENREHSVEQEEMMQLIEEIIGGPVSKENEYFFLNIGKEQIVFDLVAEGHRKLALLWLLLQNNLLNEDSLLFWDEPEANLNPSIMKKVVEILLRLQRMGAQIFLATHSYVLLDEFDLQSTDSDKIRYHSLYKEKSRKKVRDIKVASTDDYNLIDPNVILETYNDLYDRDVERALGKGKE